jgi:hypothetical protein
MRSSDHDYYSLDEILDSYNLEMKIISTVRDKFPDAGKMSFIGDLFDGLSKGFFYSPSIVTDKDLKLDFKGKNWYSLTVTPYVEISCYDKKIKVYNNILKFDFWRDIFGIEVKENPEVRWNHNDEVMLELGYKQEVIKSIYDKILEKMSEHPVTSKGYTVKLIQDGLPEYIKKYLILL